MKILIVDDEQLARERLSDLLGDIAANYEHFEAENGIVCLQIAKKENVDVVLLDIRMPGMDGLETAYHLASMEPPPAIIFTTAYQDHAIDAFNANAVDYLLKPIRKERLQESLQRASFVNRARLSELGGSMDGQKSSRNYLSATNLGSIELIPVTEIRYLKADRKYVTVGWPGHETLIDDPLKSIESEFSGRFLRVHRNALVALVHIETLEKDNEGKFSIRLNGVDEKIDISRRHLHDVRKAIKNLRLTN
ncbi:MAG: two-component system response regulator AlgR [Gammaproteobacteria bacterium]|jgi:two-component system response regulator AlgR